MNHLTKALALAAITLAGALGLTTAQASAANFNVNFAIKNADSSASMIRVGSLPAGVTGLIVPAAAISAGGFDPSTGNAVYSAVLPVLGREAHVSLTYANASDGLSNQCTFTIQVKHDANVLPYLLHFSNVGMSSCTVPADVRTVDGQFTSATYTLNWT
ncbi:MAG: hypothetical protein JWO66_1814, partial [Candidatus Eremiobacteraeota bacterium]|nr:hypothetical protein [Candidatus Eremiobacteraeota bacterium]